MIPVRNEEGEIVGYRSKEVCPDCMREGRTKPKVNYCKYHDWTYPSWAEGMAEAYS